MRQLPLPNAGAKKETQSSQSHQGKTMLRLKSRTRYDNDNRISEVKMKTAQITVNIYSDHQNSRDSEGSGALFCISSSNHRISETGSILERRQ